MSDAVDLRKYAAGSALELARGLPLALERRRTPLDAAAAQLDALVFRDPAGDHWTVGANSGRLYRAGPGGWLPTDDFVVVDDHTMLEGVARWVAWLPPALPPESPEGSPPATAAQALTRSITRARALYHTGRAGSATVQALLRDLVLIDDDRVVWTLGARTGDWYRFDGRAWQHEESRRPRVDAPPLALGVCSQCGSAAAREGPFCAQCGTVRSTRTAEVDIQPAERDARGEALAALVLAGGLLPEAVTGDWEPPPTAPEHMVACPSCGAAMRAGRTACTWCTPAVSTAPTSPPPLAGEPPRGPAEIRLVRNARIEHHPLHGDKMIIGRAPGLDIVLDDPKVSRRHAMLLDTEHGWLIAELDSPHGIKLEGRRVKHCFLRHGMVFGLGGVKLTFHQPDAAVSAAGPTPVAPTLVDRDEHPTSRTLAAVPMELNEPESARSKRRWPWLVLLVVLLALAVALVTLAAGRLNPAKAARRSRASTPSKVASARVPWPRSRRDPARRGT